MLILDAAPAPHLRCLALLGSPVPEPDLQQEKLQSTLILEAALAPRLGGLTLLGLPTSWRSYALWLAGSGTRPARGKATIHAHP